MDQPGSVVMGVISAYATMGRSFLQTLLVLHLRLQHHQPRVHVQLKHLKPVRY